MGLTYKEMLVIAKEKRQKSPRSDEWRKGRYKLSKKKPIIVESRVSKEWRKERHNSLGSLFPYWHEWSKYKSYKTLDIAKKTIKILNNKNDMFEYRIYEDQK